ncbi:MAG: hypothetical protein PHR47_01955 [Candidatus Pacebacteria bacterium]|nr:hypothetical protein [Candidatus Paceibacterota bacterium]
MSDQKLLDTIKHKILIGVNEQEIIKTLVSLGWKEEDIKVAIPLAYANKPDEGETNTGIPVPMINTSESNPKMTFEGVDNNAPKEKKKKLLYAIIIFLVLLVIAVFIFVQTAIKANPEFFSWFTKPEPVQPVKNPSTDIVIPTAEGARIFGPYSSASKLSMMDGNFAFFYEKDGSQYVNINGSISSAYQRFEKKGIARPIVPSIYENKYGYSYYNENERGWFINIDGNISGPYSDASNFYYSKAGYAYAVKNVGDIYFYLHVNDKKYGPYVTIDNSVYLSDNGFYGFSYTSKSKKYINLNGTVYGPYDNIGNGIVYKNENYYFVYSEKGKQYLNTNGKVYEVIEAVVYDYQKSIFNFSYIKDGRKYVNINGTEVLAGEQTELAQNHVFKKDDGYHVEIEGKIKGIYPKTTPIYTSGDAFIFGYQSTNGQWYVNINGVDKGPYQNVGSELFIKGEHYGFTFQKEGTWSVEIK